MQIAKLHRVMLAVGMVLSAQVLDSSLLTKVISEATARRLVHQAIVALDKPIPDSSIAPLTTYWSPEFYNYQAWLPQSDDKPLLTFFFSINPWNGEVWDTKNCKRITSPSLEQEQQTIWKRSGLPSEARGPLHYKVPGECIGIAR